MGQYSRSFWKGYKLGFLAALIDGEGAICAHSSTNSRGHIELVITNTDRGLLTKAQRLIGGHVRLREKRQPRGSRPCYNLWLSRMADLLRLLRQLQPFLTTKRAQCDAAIEYLTSRLESHSARLQNCSRDNQGRIFGTPRNPLTEQELGAILRIREANGRAAVAMTT